MQIPLYKPPVSTVVVPKSKHHEMQLIRNLRTDQQKHYFLEFDRHKPQSIHQLVNIVNKIGEKKKTCSVEVADTDYWKHWYNHFGLINEDRVTLYKVYRVTQRRIGRGQASQYNLSIDLLQAKDDDNIGVHICHDAAYDRDCFIHCCITALKNSWDMKKNIEIILEVSCNEDMDDLNNILVQYGIDIFYRIKIWSRNNHVINNSHKFCTMQTEYLRYHKNKSQEEQLRL